MSDTLLIAPLAEPLHLDHARLHLRAPAGQTAQDALIRAMVSAARRRAEAWCRKALVRQQRLLAMDCFPPVIEIPVGPLRAVQAITYVDPAGATQTLAGSAYRVDALSERGRIEPAYGTVWPSTLSVSNAVQVKYTAGYAVPIASYDAGGDAITAKGHDLAADAPVRLSNSGGAIGNGLSVDTGYYVKAPSTDTLQLALTEGGAAVDITASAGTGQSFVGVVPEDLLAALLLIVGHLYEHREENADFNVFELPLGAEALLSPYRTVRF